MCRGVRYCAVPVWIGLCAPAGTPLAVVAKLNQAANQVIRSQRFFDAVKDHGTEAGGGRAEDTASPGARAARRESAWNPHPFVASGRLAMFRPIGLATQDGQERSGGTPSVSTASD